MIGGEDGIIRIFDLSQPNTFSTPQVTLETKSGPIQTMAIEDITRFYHNDLVVADSCGMMTVFCNQQILCRQSVSDACINFIQVEVDKTGNQVIVLSDDNGLVMGVLPSSELWKVNINNTKLTKELGPKLTVKCVLSVDLTNSHGQRSSYIMVSDCHNHVYMLQQGTIVMVLETPAVITAMCPGKFVPSEKLPVGHLANGNVQTDEQVALGSENGAIFLFHNFAITEDEYANAQYPITNMESLTVTDYDTDLLLCSGHFNKLHVYSDGKKIGDYPTTDWICSMNTIDLDNDGVKEVVVGCLDNSIHAIKVSPT